MTTEPRDRGRGEALAETLRLCAAVGWEVDEQDGNRLILYFEGDRLVKRRRLWLACGEQVVIICCISTAELRADSLPAEIPAGLLRRNDDLAFEKWQMDVDDEGEVTFSCSYAVPFQGLRLEYFKDLCTSIVTEVARFDEDLAERGLYK